MNKLFELRVELFFYRMSHDLLIGCVNEIGFAPLSDVLFSLLGLQTKNLVHVLVCCIQVDNKRQNTLPISNMGGSDNGNIRNIVVSANLSVS